jgi:hypothetical protein
MLWWHKELWLIDHGAALYFHHSWDKWEQQALRPFVQIKDHVLLPWATALETVDQQFRNILTRDLIDAIVQLIPAGWLMIGSPFDSVDAHRGAYSHFLNTRIANSNIFVNAATYAG